MDNLYVSSSFRRFLHDSDNRVAQFIMRGIYYQGWGYTSSRFMIKTDEVNYLTLRDDGTISYLPKGKEHKVTDDGRWARDGRQNGAAQKIIKKLLTPRAIGLFKEVEFMSFVNQYKAACDAESKFFSIRKNVDIPDVYCMERESGGGTLSDSCMNGDRDYLDMYAHCPHVQILTLVNNCGELCGRALLWKVDDGTIMDRIYVARDHYYEMFLDYADANKFIRKFEYKTYRMKDKFVRNGEVFTKQYKIMTPTCFDRYPYIDTFTYGGDGFLSNWSNDTIHEYTCTSGGREEQDEDDGRYECAHSGNMYDGEDVVYIERGRYSGCHIHTDLSVYCETDNNRYYEYDDAIIHIDGMSCYYRRDDEDLVDIGGELYHTSDDEVKYSEYTEEYHLDDDVIYSDHHGTYILRIQAIKIDDAVYHEDDIERVA